MRKDDAIAAAAKQYGDGGSNLVCAKDNGKSIGRFSGHFLHFSCLSGSTLPAKQEPGRERRVRNAGDIGMSPAGAGRISDKAGKLRQV
jgi:hypothetical protein